MLEKLKSGKSRYPNSILISTDPIPFIPCRTPIDPFEDTFLALLTLVESVCFRFRVQGLGFSLGFRDPFSELRQESFLKETLFGLKGLEGSSAEFRDFAASKQLPAGEEASEVALVGLEFRLPGSGFRVSVLGYIGVEA